MTGGPWGRLVRGPDPDGDGDGGDVVLEFVRSLPAPPEAVWAALTEPSRTERWIGTWTGDPESGVVALYMEGADPAGPGERMVIRRCRPAELLEVESSTSDGVWPLQVRLEPDGTGTVLTFRHRLAAPVDVSSIGPGWQYYLDRLGAVVAGTEVPDDWDAYFPALADRYRALTC